MTKVRSLLETLYRGHGSRLESEVRVMAERHRRPEYRTDPWNERDAWLITYPDQFQVGKEPPLIQLRDAFVRHLADAFNGVHVLPFYPWSSDDGYSVIDYEDVAAEYGSWEHIEALAGSGRLMVDAVINHMSASSGWFRGFLQGDPAFSGFFRTADPDADLSATVRPRSLPLLHEFESHEGPLHVWTTFSSDQVDLDFRNPEVFLRVLRVLYLYAQRGASAIRLDAVSYLWKAEGTSSINLPETHLAIQALRACLDVAYPDVLLITETNVPHEQNIAYMGGSAREAQAVYQFALPPLTLHTLLTGDATALTTWAADLEDPAPDTTYFNFLASHDGIGLRPVEGLLSDEEVADMIRVTGAVGARVSTRRTPAGDVPYELNTTWFSAMGARGESAPDRHLAAHAIMLALRGIPGLYVHSLFAEENDDAAADRTGSNRAVNRRKFVEDPFVPVLADPTSAAGRVHHGMRTLLRTRRTLDAFHPDAPQRVLDLPSGVFGVERYGATSAARVIVNVSADDVSLPPWDGYVTLNGQEPPSVVGPGQSIWTRG